MRGLDLLNARPAHNLRATSSAPPLSFPYTASPLNQLCPLGYGGGGSGDSAVNAVQSSRSKAQQQEDIAMPVPQAATTSLVHKQDVHSKMPALQLKVL